MTKSTAWGMGRGARRIRCDHPSARQAPHTRTATHFLHFRLVDCQ